MSSAQIASMQTTPASLETPSSSTHGAVAPAWHTLVVLLAMLGFSLAGALNHGLSLGHPNGRALGYVIVMVFEWFTVAFIWYGLRRRGIRMADLIAGSWARPKYFFRDFGIAMAFLLVGGFGLVQGLIHLLKAAPDPAIMNLLPQSPLEIALYLTLSLTAGFCEEVIFRGYLQRQFTALTRSAAAGIALQGIAFGLSHGYQGWKFMLVIAAYGTAFGLLAQWRRSLRPGMITHFVQDGVLGTLARFLH